MMISKTIDNINGHRYFETGQARSPRYLRRQTGSAGADVVEISAEARERLINAKKSVLGKAVSGINPELRLLVEAAEREFDRERGEMVRMIKFSLKSGSYDLDAVIEGRDSGDRIA